MQRSHLIFNIIILFVSTYTFAQQPPQNTYTQQAPQNLQQITNEPQYTVIRRGTTISTRLAQNINGNLNSQGDTIYFEVIEDVKVDNLIVIKKGTFARGKITTAEKRKSMGKAGKISIEARSLVAVDGQIINLVDDAMSSEGRKRTGATVAHVIMWGPLGLFAKGRAARVMMDTVYDLEIDEDISVNTNIAHGFLEIVAQSNNILDIYFNEYKGKVNFAKGKVGKDFYLNIVLPKYSEVNTNTVEITNILNHKLPTAITPIQVYWDNKTNTFVAVFSFKEMVKYSLPGSSKIKVQINTKNGSVFIGETKLITKWKMK